MSRVFCSTYKKYAEGSLKGAWLDLEDYACKQDFYEACAELHKDESDPEIMFQDHEDIPSMFITECSIDEEFWGYMDCRLDDDVKKAYIEACDVWDAEGCEASYIGRFRDDAEMVENVADETGLLDEIPENLRYYFDYEAYGRDIRLGGDVREYGGYYFWRH